MIVTLHPSMANRHNQLDPNIRIQVERFKDRAVSAVKVKGNQLLIAGVHTFKSVGHRIEPDRTYGIILSDVVPCHIKPNAEWAKHRKVDMDYVFQVQGWDEDGCPLVCMWDLLDATGSAECLYYQAFNRPGLVPIRDDCYEPC